MPYIMEVKMPPKSKVSKEDILEAAVAIVRANGAQTINARTIPSFTQTCDSSLTSNFSIIQSDNSFIFNQLLFFPTPSPTPHHSSLHPLHPPQTGI